MHALRIKEMEVTRGRWKVREGVVSEIRRVHMSGEGNVLDK